MKMMKIIRMMMKKKPVNMKEIKKMKSMNSINMKNMREITKRRE